MRGCFAYGIYEHFVAVSNIRLVHMVILDLDLI